MSQKTFIEILNLYQKEFLEIDQTWRSISKEFYDGVLQIAKAEGENVNDLEKIYNYNHVKGNAIPNDLILDRRQNNDFVSWLENCVKPLKRYDVKISETIQTVTQLTKKPEIKIAVAGTTSSGKSSLVDLLCGSKIMAVHAQEMSAGTVIIKHGNKKQMTVQKTAGATWQTGSFAISSDEDIRKRLTDIMVAYNDLKQKKPDTLPPQIELEYPTRIGLSAKNLGLPEQFALTILDLPGLRHSGDKGNQSVIENARDAICIVTYNGEETDEIKQATLLEQVANQVKEFGGSPKRMLFVLNRIDAIGRDAKNITEYNNEINKFVTKTKNKIIDILTKALPEYTKDIKTVGVGKLSSRPALYAYMLNSSQSTQWLEYAEDLDRSYGKLIPDEILDDLPRRHERWELEDRKKVGQAVWKTSFAEDFEQFLTSHIRDNLAELIFYPHFKRAQEQIMEATNDIISMIEMIQTTSQADYEHRVSKINDFEQWVETDAKKLFDRFRELTLQYRNITQKEANYTKEINLLKDISSFLQFTDVDSLNVLQVARTGFPNILRDIIIGCLEAYRDGNKTAIRRLFEELGGDNRKCESLILSIENLRNNALFKELQNQNVDIFSNSTYQNKKNECQGIMNSFGFEFQTAVEALYESFARREQNRMDKLFESVQSSFIEKLHSTFSDVLDRSNLLLTHDENRFPWKAPTWESFELEPPYYLGEEKSNYLWTSNTVHKANLKDVLNTYRQGLEEKINYYVANAMKTNLDKLLNSIEQKQRDIVKNYKQSLRTFYQRKAESEHARMQQFIDALNANGVAFKQKQLQQKIKLLQK